MEAKAIYKFDATSSDELPFQCGDVLKVKNKNDKDWYQAEMHGRKGFIPNTYISMEAHDWYKGNMPRSEAEDYLMKPPSGAAPFDGSFIVRDCQADKEHFSLSVLHGGKPQHFKILSSPNGTYYLWPDKHFTSINKLIEHYRSVSVAKEPHKTILLRDSESEELFEAMYDFQSDSPEELSFHRGCRIRILDKSDPNWWSGEIVGSKTCERGLLPHNYIRKL